MEKTRFKLTKKLSGEALIKDSRQREEFLKTEVEALGKKAHEAELKTSMADTRCQELEKQNTRLESPLKDKK